MTVTSIIGGDLLKKPENYTVYSSKDEFGEYIVVEWVDPDTNKRVGIQRHKEHTGMTMFRVEHKPFDFIEIVLDQDLEESIYKFLRR